MKRHTLNITLIFSFFVLFALVAPTVTNASECKIYGGLKPTWIDNYTPGTKAKLSLYGLETCEGKTIQFVVIGHNSGWAVNFYDGLWGVKDIILKKEYTVPKTSNPQDRISYLEYEFAIGTNTSNLILDACTEETTCNYSISYVVIDGIGGRVNAALNASDYTPLETAVSFKRPKGTKDSNWKVVGGPVTKTLAKMDLDDKKSALNINDICADKKASGGDCFELLAPIFTPEQLSDLSNNTLTLETKNGRTAIMGKLKLGSYINLMLRVIIGFLGIIAVVKIIYEGVRLMTTVSANDKTEYKKNILSSLFGLVLALGSFMILNTINPDLLELNLSDTMKTKSITVGSNIGSFDIGSKHREPVDSKGEVLETFSLGAGAYSLGTEAFVKDHLKKGGGLANISINSKTKAATFYAKDGSSFAIPINGGSNGFSAKGTGKEGDKKTPLGMYTIGGGRFISPDGKQAVLTQEKLCDHGTQKCNLGAAFIEINIPGRDGIAFHGAYDNNLRETNACIRMKNGDLLLLAPFMTSGISVEIY